jgi:hypothetical protein
MDHKQRKMSYKLHIYTCIYKLLKKIAPSILNAQVAPLYGEANLNFHFSMLWQRIEASHWTDRRPLHVTKKNCEDIFCIYNIHGAVSIHVWHTRANCMYISNYNILWYPIWICPKDRTVNNILGCLLIKRNINIHRMCMYKSRMSIKSASFCIIFFDRQTTLGVWQMLMQRVLFFFWWNKYSHLSILSNFWSIFVDIIGSRKKHFWVFLTYWK